MRNRIVVVLLCVVMMAGIFSACGGNSGGSSTPGPSGGSTSTPTPTSGSGTGTEGFGGAITELTWEEKYGELTDVDYDAILAALPPLTAEEQERVVQIGYFDCDHMVPGPIGEMTGIYEMLGVKVVVTKTGQVNQAMAAGQMDFGYMGINGAGTVRAIRDGSPLKVVSGNHTGGSNYLVVSNEINAPEELLGLRMAIGNEPQNSVTWVECATSVGLPIGGENYETFAMKDRDELFALQAGQLDAFTCCDPYGSYAEYLGVGKIIATAWGAATNETSGTNAGIHCTFAANSDFLDAYPNLALRVLYAHVLSIQYIYQHPYTAGEIFAEVFDVPTEVGLRTIYVKAIAEGRTINWELSEGNWQTFLNEYIRWDINPEFCPDVTMDDIDIIWRNKEMNAVYELGVPDFQDFIKEKVDSVFPVGMTYEEFVQVAKEIDYIEE